MAELKNGILVRFPLIQKRIKKSGYRVSFADFIQRKINEGLNIGYKCFVFEIADEDFNSLDFEINRTEKISLDACLKKEIRIAFYIKGRKYLTSDSEDEIKEAHSQIVLCLNLIKKLNVSDPQQFPIVLHIGGAKGDRRGTMEDFCKKVECWFLPEDIERLSVVNDEKPSLFSVKDLLPGVFYRIKIPIVFRSTSYPTNQGNLTLNESLFLAASTWKRTVNPIFLYLPGNTQLEQDQTRPFGLELDVIFDNMLPEP